MPGPSDAEKTRPVRVPSDTYEVVKRAAQRERRTITQQLAVMVERAEAVSTTPGAA